MNIFPLPLKFQNQGHATRPSFCGAKNETQGFAVLGKDSSNSYIPISLHHDQIISHEHKPNGANTLPVHCIPVSKLCISVHAVALFIVASESSPKLTSVSISASYPPSNPRPLGSIHCYLTSLNKLYDHMSALILTLLWKVLLLSVGAGSQ